MATRWVYPTSVLKNKLPDGTVATTYLPVCRLSLYGGCMLWLWMTSLGLANAQGKKKNNTVQPFMGGWGVSAQSILISFEYPQFFPKSTLWYA